MNSKQLAAPLFALAICLCATAPTHAVLLGTKVVDSGTPDESSNRSVFLDSTLPGGQYIAQSFSLSAATNVISIETYLGGNGADPIDAFLTTAIGPGTVPGDVVTSYTMLPPGTSPSAGDWVAQSVNLNLAAGTYYMVYSSPDGDDGAFLPIDAPNNIGSSFLVAEGSLPFNNINEAFPPASDFSSRSVVFGLRIYAVPEPATYGLALVGLAMTLAPMRRRQHA